MAARWWRQLLLTLLLYGSIICFLRLHIILQQQSLFAEEPFIVSSSRSHHQDPATALVIHHHQDENYNNKLKIAIITGFVVVRLPGPKAKTRIDDLLLDHMLNKACYADLHGYDFIFNTTPGFPPQRRDGRRRPKQWWLDFGTWHRVPHIQAALPKYDWILYADTDWVVQDMALPLEALLKELELYHGKKSQQQQHASVYLPVESNNRLTFSAYVILIRNSPFGNRLIENWMEFAWGGVCEKGNFPTNNRAYQWYHSDQPGLWWALAKTHAEFTNNLHEFYKLFRCNNNGYIESARWCGPEFNRYFETVAKYRAGSQGKELDAVPDNQYIIWSQVHKETRSGLGYQATYGDRQYVYWPHAFAMHSKAVFNPPMKRHLEYCRKERGCYAYYYKNKNHSGGEDVLQIGCSNGGSSSSNKLT